MKNAKGMSTYTGDGIPLKKDGKWEPRKYNLLVTNESSQSPCFSHDGATSRTGMPLLRHTLHRQKISQLSMVDPEEAGYQFNLNWEV